MNTEAIEAEEVKLNEAIVPATPKSTPIKFDVTEAAIKRMQDHAGTLVITGPNDKAGYEAVFNFRQTVKNQRIAVEKKAKELKAPHTAYNRKVDAAAKEIVEPLEAIEDGMAKQEKSYKDERERLANEKAALIRDRYQKRVLALKDLGFVFDDVAETYGLAGLYINKDDIRDFSDEEYAPTFCLAETTAKTEQERIAEEQRLIDEKNRIAADAQKAEQDRVAAERKKLEEEQAELKRQQDELAADQKRIQEKEDALLKTRIERLVAVGYKEINGNYHLHNLYARHTSLLTDTEAEFEKAIQEAQEYNQQREEERSKAETDRLNAQKQLDEERKNRLAPDRPLILSFLQLVRQTECSEYETLQLESKALVVAFDKDLEALVGTYQTKLEDL